jgi:hypothetical protein
MYVCVCTLVCNVFGSTPVCILCTPVCNMCMHVCVCARVYLCMYFCNVCDVCLCRYVLGIFLYKVICKREHHTRKSGGEEAVLWLL